MNNIVIFLFILVANVVSILLIYYSFNKNIEKTKRLLYTMIAMGVIYILVLIVYFFSSIGMPKEIAEQSKEMITFTFVPVNAIILIPFLLRSFNRRKDNSITTEQLNKRAIIVVIVAIALLVGEFFYFRNIEKGINDRINQKRNEQNSIVNNAEENNFYENEEIINNGIIDNEISNDVNIQVNNVEENLRRNLVPNETYVNDTY